jgi:acyl carrier protein
LEQTGLQIIVAENAGVVPHRNDTSRLSNHKTPTDLIRRDSAKLLSETSATSDVTDQMVQDHIKEILIEKLSDSLRIEKMTIDDEMPFTDYGVDSLTGVNLTQDINQALKIELEMTRLFEYNSVNQLTEYICTQYKDILARTLKAKSKHAHQELTRER